MRHQEESLKNFRDPFANGAAHHGNGSTQRGGMQAAQDGMNSGDHASFQGNLQGSPATQGNQNTARAGKAA